MKFNSNIIYYPNNEKQKEEIQYVLRKLLEGKRLKTSITI